MCNEGEHRIEDVIWLNRTDLKSLFVILSVFKLLSTIYKKNKIGNKLHVVNFITETRMPNLKVKKTYWIYMLIANRVYVNFLKDDLISYVMHYYFV